MKSLHFFICLALACGTQGEPCADCLENDAYTETNPGDISVLALNTWGIPGSPDLVERMEAIGDHVAREQYDVVLLNEVWIKTHHDIITASLPDGYNITTYEQLNGQGCWGSYMDQYFGLKGCSGLAILSRLPMSNITFTPFSSTGRFTNLLYDGEILSQKGVGSVTLTLDSGLTADVLVTHMASETWNADIREIQVQEFLGVVNSSTATFVIGGGDFNLWPVSEAYRELTGVMVNAFEEMLPRTWNQSDFSTWGHRYNTFTNELVDEVVDYIFYYTTDDSEGIVETKTCWLPFLMAKSTKSESIMSVSDHQGIVCTFSLPEKEHYDESGWSDLDSG